MEYLKHLLVRTPLERPLVAVKRGLARVKRWHKPELIELSREEARIDAVLGRIIKPDSNCVDVGAHLGSILSRIVKHAPGGKHVAIEAVPRKARWLREKFPEVQVHELAASDEAGRAEFFEHVQQSGFSGLRFHEAGRHGIRKLDVARARLDELLPEALPIAFIKVDVEGGDLDVLRGAARTLERWRPAILMESTLSGLAAYGLTTRDVYDFLTGVGYQVATPRVFLANEPPMSFERFDEAHRYPFEAFNFVATPVVAMAAGEPLRLTA